MIALILFQKVSSFCKKILKFNNKNKRGHLKCNPN